MPLSNQIMLLINQRMPLITEHVPRCPTSRIQKIQWSQKISKNLKCVFQDFDLKINISEKLRDGSIVFFGPHLFQNSKRSAVYHLDKILFEDPKNLRILQHPEIPKQNVLQYLDRKIKISEKLRDGSIAFSARIFSKSYNVPWCPI